ncbi:MAG TPA: 7-carboxy-7-deazaguanine synthase QueE [Haliangiales bacterium]|nr:7-carboxy-7-deazaguanine synthase QueE [Haliangiales bacterium]
MKEIFGPTLQGEGAHAGRPCVFLRFAVCNLACTWCDTDFRPEGAATMSADEIAARLVELDAHATRMVVVTGGEPALQWDEPLAAALRAAGFRVHMETNGTRELAAPVDWLTVSPKPQFHEGRFELRLRGGDECKLIVDDAVGDADLERYETWPFGALFLQPCMDERYAHHLGRAVDLVSRHPRWRLSLQLHKIVGIP